MVDAKASGAVEMLEAVVPKDLSRLEKQTDGHLVKFSQGKCKVLPSGKEQFPAMTQAADWLSRKQRLRSKPGKLLR